MDKYNLNNSYKAVVIGGSAGSFQGIVKILAQLPKTFPLPIIMCLHRLKHVRNGFVEALSLKSVVQVLEPNDKEQIKKGGVYLAPSNYHMSVELGNHFSMSTDRDKLIGILLSGANRDGGLGMKHIKDKGGLTIVQEPTECMIDTMPKAALALTKIDHTMKIDQIVEFLIELDKQYK
jgi:two-component system, chemotaxis family, protein-glutamate methylesterase/glutaminase